MRGVISTDLSNPDALGPKGHCSIRKMDGTDLARVVSTKSIYPFDAADSPQPVGRTPVCPMALVPRTRESVKLHVVVYDFGIKLEHSSKLNPRRLPRHRRPR